MVVPLDKLTAYVGIDPGGSSGAIAVVTEDGAFQSVWDMPKQPEHLGDILDEIKGDYRHVIIAVEAVHSMPTDGRKSAFAFGKNVGHIEAALQVLRLPYTTVQPQVWKKFFNLIGTDKEAARQLAISMWPDAPLQFKTKHGRADALLIAEFRRISQIGLDTDPDTP
jgi:crossover junction endodeoxyribonuclease RuvC